MILLLDKDFKMLHFVVLKFFLMLQNAKSKFCFRNVSLTLAYLLKLPYVCMFKNFLDS